MSSPDDLNKPQWFKLGSVRAKQRKRQGTYYVKPFHKEFVKNSWIKPNGTNVRVFSNFYIRCYKPTKTHPEFRILIQVSNGAGSGYCDPTLEEFDQMLSDLNEYRSEMEVPFTQAYKDSLAMLARKGTVETLTDQIMNLETPIDDIDEMTKQLFTQSEAKKEQIAIKEQFIRHLKAYVNATDASYKAYELQWMLNIFPNKLDDILKIATEANPELLDRLFKDDTTYT